MPTDCIPFKETNYFSNLICDYLDENEQLKPFYGRFPKIENFKAQIEEKSGNFSVQSRNILTAALVNQYKHTNTSKLTQQHIDSLKQETTFTVTTGHQLNIFTGPLYFFYKIISTINLCKSLKQAYPNYNFVPIYWMATEDHDFEEINYFNVHGKKIQWNRETSGAVGVLDLQGLESVFKVYSQLLNSSDNALKLKALFQEAYVTQNNLADATRYLVNEIFKDYGLVILDGDDKDLKKQFIPFVSNELLNKTSFQRVTKTNKKLNELPNNYKIQVNPREINLFYLNDGLRERIVETDGNYSVFGTTISWSKEELLNEVKNAPERFSPNVIMRPLYQEVVLPNLCYIGGGGELAYWFQLKTNFEAQKVTFPILLLRNSALLMTQKQSEKHKKLNISLNDLFLKQSDLITKVTKAVSEIPIDLTPQKELLKKQFEELYTLAKQTDASFLGAVGAQERKQIKGLEHLEKRLLKAQKRKLKTVLDRVCELQNDLFPNQSLQERHANFSEFYLEYGDAFVPKLIEVLNPLKDEFYIIEL